MKRVICIFGMSFLMLSTYSCRETTEEKAKDAIDAIGEDVEAGTKKAAKDIKEGIEEVDNKVDEGLQEIENHSHRDH